MARAARTMDTDASKRRPLTAAAAALPPSPARPSFFNGVCCGTRKEEERGSRRQERRQAPAPAPATRSRIRHVSGSCHSIKLLPCPPDRESQSECVTVECASWRIRSECVCMCWRALPIPPCLANSPFSLAPRREHDRRQRRRNTSAGFGVCVGIGDDQGTVSGAGVMRCGGRITNERTGE